MSWLSRFVNVVRRDRVDRDLDEEIRFHLAARTEELTSTGMPAAEAQAHASRQFGNTLLLRESSRDIKLSSRLESILLDVAFGLRLWRSNKIVTAAAVVSLALAIGACTAAFSLDRRADPAVAAGERSRVADLHRVPRAWRHPRWPQLQLPTLRRDARCEPCARPALCDERSIEGRRDVRRQQRQPERVYGQWISGDALAILGVKPALGRLLTPSDDLKPGQHPVAVLSYDFWSRRFGRNPAVLGRWVTIRDKPLQIVGVAEKGFTGVEPGIMTDIWAPNMMWDDRAISDSSTRWFRIWGRMQPDVAPEQARAVLQAVFTNFRREQAAMRPAEPRDRVERFIQHCGPSAIGGERSLRTAAGLRTRVVGPRLCCRSGVAHCLLECGEPAGRTRGLARAGDGAAHVDWRRARTADSTGADRKRASLDRLVRAGRAHRH